MKVFFVATAKTGGFMDILFLAIGFVFLVKGADFFVSGASGIAKKLRVSALIIGLTIVAFGTSAPELAVSVNSSIAGSSSICMGNIVGSNIFNLLVVLGVSATISTVVVSKDIIKKDYPISIIAVGIIFVFGVFEFFGDGDKTVSLIEGIILLGIFVVYMIKLVSDGKKQAALHSEEETKSLSMPKALILTGVGLAGIIIGSQMVVNGASGIARSLGVSEEIIGLTIVAIGTSLPELVTSIVAARKGENEIAVGNVVGSNIFNILLIGGVCATLSPTQVSEGLLADMLLLVIAAAAVFVPILTKKKISRPIGIAMTAAYCIYMIYLIFFR